jgi:hypothetical protein
MIVDESVERYVDNPLLQVGQNTGFHGERGVRKDPDNGHIVIHPAYEGWKPAEYKISRRAATFVISGASLVLWAIIMNVWRFL